MIRGVVGKVREEAMEMGGGGPTERHFMSRGGLKNVGNWPQHRAARELGLSGGIRGDRIEMSTLTQTHSLSHTQTHTPPQPGMLPGHSVAVMPLNSRLYHTHSEQSWSPSKHQHLALIENSAK